MTTFDYQAALKEQPESEVAKYLAEQHGVDRDAYLKDGHSDTDFINEYGPREFPEDQANDTQYNKTGAATLGAIAGASPTLLRTAKGVVQGAAHGFLNRAPQAPTFTPPSAPPAGGLPTSSVQVMSPSTGEAVHGGQTWVKKLTGVDLPGAQMEKSALDKAKEMSSVVGRGGELAGGEITSSGIMLPPARTTAEQAAAEKAALREAQLSETGQAAARKYLAEKAAEKAGTIAAGPSIGQRVLQAGQSVLEAPGVSKVLKVAGPIAGLASAAEQYEDMRERMHHGDYARGVVSGLGALGSGVATVPFFPPQVRAIGAGVGLAAPGINYLADKVAGRSYASGGLVYLADGGQPPKPYADDGADTGPYIGYRPVQRQAQNQYGSGSGFLDAALGAPAQHTNVLDPRDASYMSGYEKGEPVGIAAMALPAVGGAKGAIRNAMPPKLLDVSKYEFLHGTTPEAKAAILASDKFDPYPARWPSYSYSEMGAGTTYATPKQGWWLDPEKAASGRAAQYKSAVGVDIDPAAKIAHIRNADDWNHFAKKMGFESGDDLYRNLSAENLDAYNYAKNLTPQQYDQLQMERVQKARQFEHEFGIKPGDFHYTPPEEWERQINEIPGSQERALNEPSITGPQAAVQQIRDKGYHGIYVDKHGTEDYRIKIPADEQLAIFDQSIIKPNPNAGYKKGGLAAFKKK